MINADKPSLYDDQLNYKKYAKALARVIKDAETPFTIGISGEWGYGKTTLMNLIAYYLDKNYYEDNKRNINCEELKSDIEGFHGDEDKFTTIFLNTWPFINSQDIGESIFEQVMYELIKIIKNNRRKFRVIGKFLLKAIGATLKTVKFNGKLKFGFGEVGASFDPSKFSMDDMFVTDGVYKNFKIEVEEILNEITKKLGKLVIFIDDLDRLYPKQALEVILFMKNFLDVKDCIFVIGTDNEVLKEGLEELYGKYGNDKDGKGREEYLKKIKNNFFEKIYQLEFRIPLLLKDNISNYIDKLVDTHYFIEEDLKELKEYLATNEITLNPRRLKKIINIYNLVNEIVGFNSADNINYVSKINRAIFELSYIYIDDFELFSKIKKGELENEKISDFLKQLDRSILNNIIKSFGVENYILPLSEIINLLNNENFDVLLNNDNYIELAISYLLDSVNDNQNTINKFIEYTYTNHKDKMNKIRSLLEKYNGENIERDNINIYLNS